MRNKIALIIMLSGGTVASVTCIIRQVPLFYTIYYVIVASYNFV